MKKISMKTKIFFWLSSSICRPIIPVLAKTNMLIFHHDKKQRVIRKIVAGEKKKYYIHRGSGGDDTVGLLSLYNTVLQTTYAYEKMGYASYVDYEAYGCQYSVERKINGTNNAWEYYFQQPHNVNRQEAYAGDKVILSGWTWFKNKRRLKFEKEFLNLPREERKNYMLSTCPIQKSILERVNEIYNHSFKGHVVMGVFLRGTDYIQRRPIGHPIQPTVDQVIPVIEQFVQKYLPDKIFLVTEDETIYNHMKDLLNVRGLHVFCSDYHFIKFNPQNEAWVKDTFDDDPYERGVNYLVRILLLARCDYFVGGKASGSAFALNIADYKEKYVFDLGRY